MFGTVCPWHKSGFLLARIIRPHCSFRNKCKAIAVFRPYVILTSTDRDPGGRRRESNDRDLRDGLATREQVERNYGAAGQAKSERSTQGARRKLMDWWRRRSVGSVLYRFTYERGRRWQSKGTPCREADSNGGCRGKCLSVLYGPTHGGRKSKPPIGGSLAPLRRSAKQGERLPLLQGISRHRTRSR